jgi:CHAT domain-containing protein
MDTLLILVDVGFDILTDSNVSLSSLQNLDILSIRNIPIFIHLLDSYIYCLIRDKGVNKSLLELFKLRHATIQHFYSRYGSNSIFLQNSRQYFENIESIFLQSEKIKGDDLTYLLDASRSSLLESEKSKISKSRSSKTKSDSLRKIIIEYDYLIDRLKVGLSKEINIKEQGKISLRLFQLNGERDIVMKKFTKEIENDNIILSSNLDNSISLPYLRFYQGEATSFSFLVKKDTTIVNELEWGLHANSILRRIILQVNNSGLDHKDVGYSKIKFCQDLRFLFDKLLTFNCLNSEFSNLTIIPDGTLNYLPFELLLTEDVDTTKPINWFDLPYLFKKVNINYQYSARLAAMDRETNPKNKGVLAFAPQYQGYVSDDRAFGNLIYNQRELESIKKYFPGEFYGGADADKKTFLEKASDFKVIHLASHAMVDNENPELSSLFFTDINQDSTQNPLYPYEIQSTPLNADLVVLSACQSGTGKLHRGEGVFSLARNFIAAGAKSVVNSLWKVDDESTSRLMGYFYENLAKGQRKSEALRNAKLTFLENADAMTSHPYFWSGFVLIGDDAPIKRKSNTLWWIIGGVFAVASGGLIYRSVRQKGNNRKQAA